jgi:hypothetical protein
MTQTYEVQTIFAGGIPFTEYRHAPDITDIQIVCIEFKPDQNCIQEYTYPQPKYTITETVAKRSDWECIKQSNADWREHLNLYRVVGLRLVEYFSSNGKLKETPRWIFGVSRQSSREVVWMEEDDLVSVQELEPDYYEF